MLIQYIYYAIIVVVVALLWLYVFRKFGWLDRPGWDRIPPRTFRVPNFQWIIMILGIWIWLSLFFPEMIANRQIILLLFFATWYALFNLANDIIDLRTKMIGIPAWFRLIVQFLIVWIYIYISQIYTNINLFDMQVNPVLWFIILLFWIVWFINAINFFDGVHAMASGVSSIWFISIFLIIQLVVIVVYQNSITSSEYLLLNDIKSISLLLAISTLVYCVVEYKPNGVIRDVGFSFIWFVLAVLAMLGWAKIGTILVVLSLPIFDSIWVFLNRIFIMKKNPMKWDFTHLHHRLMVMGRSRGEIRVAVRVYTIFMTTLMLLLYDSSLWKIIVFTMILVIFFMAHVYLYRYKKLPYELLKREKTRDSDE